MKNAQEHWIKHIYSTLSEARQIPMWGSLPSFDWEVFSSGLSESLEIDDVAVSATAPEWINSEKLLTGLGSLGSKGSVEVMKVSDLAGQLLWIMSGEDREKLTSLLLSSSPIKGFTDPRFQAGFYKYVMLEVMNCFEKIGSYPDLHPRQVEEDIYTENYCVVPVCIKIRGLAVWGKLAISAQLQGAIKSHYAEKLPSLATHPLASDLDLSLKLQVANTTLPLSAWQTVKNGDCILLDRCSYDPEQHKGSVSILLEETPVFRAKLKKNTLKILDYAFYYEEEKTMADDLTPDEEPIEDDFTEEKAFSESEEGQDHLWSEKNGSNVVSGSTEKLISSNEIPLTLVVEVDRIRMSLDKLLQLTPGNVLELAVRPEQGVHVTIGGKRVARAELIKLGDTLGIKILQLGENAD